MKKGFTLIELLIVMVIVSSLIAVALPKYNRAMERGRTLEGINKVKYAAEYAVAKCMVTDGKIQQSDAKDVTKGQDTFQTPHVEMSGCAATVTVKRNPSSGWYYTLKAVSEEDKTTVTCINNNQEDNEDHCVVLGLTSEDLLK